MIELTMIEGTKILVNALHVVACHKRKPSDEEKAKEPKRADYGTVVVMSGTGAGEIRVVVSEKYSTVKEKLMARFNGQ